MLVLTLCLAENVQIVHQSILEQPQLQMRTIQIVLYFLVDENFAFNAIDYLKLFRLTSGF